MTELPPSIMDSHHGNRCATCGAAIPWRVVKFCLNLRSRFGGRAYCIGCQATFPAV